MNIKKFQISIDSSLKEALYKIDKNQEGIIYVCSSDNKVLGVATDGDIRRKLLEGAKLSNNLHEIVNKKFVWKSESSSREEILKILDSKIKSIPIIDEHGRLVEIVSKNYLPLKNEESIIVRSRSPVRISFAGGGSDVTNYFDGNKGATLNTTISLYSHALLKKRNDNAISVRSLDLNSLAVAGSLKEFLLLKNSFGLIQAIIKIINPDFGFDLEIYSDIPIKSGLGGSAAISAAILGCFNQLRTDEWNLHELAELSFQAERLYLQIAGGWQDQYATVFGGLNFIEFNKDKNIIHPLRLPKDVSLELEESLVLCDTKISHESGSIHVDQKEQTKKIEILNRVKSNVELAYIMRDMILRGKLIEFGKSLDKTWKIKRSLSTQISSSYLDQIYAGAIDNGAIGGKILGAGGGGFFLFFVPPFNRLKVIKNLIKLGLNVKPFIFEKNGLKSWKTRQHYTS